MLADDFVSQDLDLKRLIANIMQSEAYRRGSVWSKKHRPKENQYAMFNLRPLTPSKSTADAGIAKNASVTNAKKR